MTDASTLVSVVLTGGLQLYRGDQPQSLPSSRKTRALLVWLWLNPGVHRRERLASLLWPASDDPRAGLRWSLNKLRPLLGELLRADRDTVELRREATGDDPEACLARLEHGEPGVSADLDSLLAHLERGYLLGLDCDDCADYELWLETERARMREIHARLLLRASELAAEPARRSEYLRRLLTLKPGDVDAGLRLMETELSQSGVEVAQQQMEKLRERMRRAGLDDEPLLRGWRRLSAAAMAASPARSSDSQSDSRDSGQGLSLPGKPSLAVLPFENLGEPAVDTLSRGIGADLVTRLSRVGGLFVIARASSMRFSPRSLAPSEIGRRLGVRYLIHGSVLLRGQRLRVNVELMDAESGRDVWVDTIDAALDDLFLLQEQIADTIVSAVEPEIERAEYERARLKQPDSLDAWENYHLAMWHSFRFTGADTERAAAYLERALALDPHFCRAHAALSLVHFSRAFLDSCENPGREIERAIVCAETSLSLDGRDAMAHWSLGRARFLNRDHDQALASLERAIEANPNYAQGHYARGFVGVHAGIPDLALGELDHAQRLSPYDPLLFAMKSSRALSLIMQERFAEAADWSVKGTLEPNAHYHIHAIAAACLELKGDRAAAAEQIATALARHPGYGRETFFRSFPYKFARHRDVISDALERVGLPA